MNIILCANPSDITSYSLESSQSIKINKSLSTSSNRASDFVNKDNIQVSSRDARKSALSCQYVPKQLEETCLVGKPAASKPKQKLEFIRTLLIDNYDSYTYNIYQELSVVNGCKLILSCVYINSQKACSSVL